MGYNTDFEGELKFTYELKSSELADVKNRLGEHSPIEGYGCLDLEFTDNFDGLRWSGAEKTYDLEKHISWLIRHMREKHKDFGLTGELLAQGEDYEDRWILKIVGGLAVKIDQPRIGEKILCPRCEEHFTLEIKQ